MSEEVCPNCEQASGGVCRRCLASELFSEENEEFELPDVLGGFVVRERIGRGASGEVWLAFQPGPDREVALKVFLDPRLGGVADRARFMAEAQALGKLDHPAIVPVYATGEEAGFLFIASRWMPGGTLAERDPSKPVTARDWPDLVRCLLTVTRAVAHAHRHGLVHRDIKPANILIGSAGEPYLADFGIAVNEGETEGHYTSGTPAYMAPEQARGEVVTTSADVYSLGALMFDLLTGGPPLGTEESVRERLDGVHPDLRAICLRCLEHDPSARYDSAGDLSDDFQRWLEGRPVEARPVGRWVRVIKWARRRPAVAAMAGVALLSALVLVGTLLVGTEMLRGEKNYAVLQEQVAKVNEKRASIMAENFQQHAYAADMYAAGSALSDGQRGVARRMLDRHRATFGDGDVRDFAWYAYDALIEGDEEAIFEGHENSVMDVTFSPDGRYFASGGTDGRVLVHALESREVVMSLPREDAPVGAMEIPLMTRVALRTPELREKLLSGELGPDEVRMRSRPSRLGDIEALEWAPNGKILVTIGGGSYVRFWSFPEGELVGLLPLTSVKDLAFSSDGRYLVLLRDSNDGWYQLLVYDTVTLQRVFEVNGAQRGFAVRGDRMAYLSGPKDFVTLTQLGDPSKMITWPAGTTVSKLAFSYDGQQLLGLGRRGRELFYWDAPTGKLHSEVDLGADAFRALGVYQDGLVMAGSRQRIDFCRGFKALESRSFLRGHEDEILSLSVSPDAKWLVSSGKDRSVRLWKMPEKDGSDDDAAVAIPSVKCHAPDGLGFLGETGEDHVFLRRFAGELIKLGDEMPRRALSFEPGGERVLTWREEGQGVLIERWNTLSGERMAEGKIEMPFVGPYQLSASGDRSRFVVKAENTSVHFFDLMTLVKVGELPVPREGEVRVVLSRDGEKVAYVFWPRSVLVGELGKGWRPKWRLTKGMLGPLEFSADGKWLVSGNDENRIAIHDAETGELLQSIPGHHQRMVALAVSPDGKTIASSSDDLTLRIWHIPTWRELGVLKDGVTCYYLGFDEDSRRIGAAFWGGVKGSSILAIPGL